MDWTTKSRIVLVKDAYSSFHVCVLELVTNEWIARTEKGKQYGQMNQSAFYSAL